MLKRFCIFARVLTFAVIASTGALSATSLAIAQSTPPQFVYTADEATQSISGFQLNPTTGVLSSIPGSPLNERLDPFQLAVNPSGTFLFVANFSFNDVSVFRINQSNGALTEVPNSPFSAGNGTGPAYLTTDVTGKFLYVANSVYTANPAVGEIDAYAIDPATGALTPTPSTAAAGQAAQCPLNAVGIFAHPGGQWIYVSGSGTGASDLTNTIQGYTINSATGDMTAFSTTYQGGEQPEGLAGDAAFLFSDHGQHEVFIDTVAISPVDGSLALLTSNLVEQSELPVAMTVDSTGNFLYTNLGGFQINQTTGVLTLAQPNGGSTARVPWTASLISPFVFSGDPASPAINAYQIGSTTGVLTAAPDSPYTTSALVESIAVTGYSPTAPAPAASFSPTAVVFASTLIGENSAEIVGLYNTGTAALSISGVSITGAGSGNFSQANDCPNSLPAGSNCAINVTFTPGTAGPLVAALSVADNAPGSPQTAELSGTGVTPAPMVSVTPSSYTFPATNIGATSAPQTFTFTNTGTATLEISSLTLGGPNPGDFTETNACGTSVIAASHCTVTIAFAPQATGTRTATVNITDNAPDSPQSISLTGTSNAPFAIAPAASGGATASISPTGSANYNLQFVPAGNFSGNVSMACKGAPANSSCSVSPASFQASATTIVPVVVTAGVTMTGSVPAGTTSPWAKNSQASDLIRTAGVFLAFFVLIVLRDKRHVIFTVSGLRLFARDAGAAAALTIVLLATSCGGGQSSAQKSIQPGQYTLTVTATSGAASQNITLTLNVTTSQ
jgi:6-phosphogluconolactonase (cycloisomerase 2 family)